MFLDFCATCTIVQNTYCVVLDLPMERLYTLAESLVVSGCQGRTWVRGPLGGRKAKALDILKRN